MVLKKNTENRKTMSESRVRAPMDRALHHEHQ